MKSKLRIFHIILTVVFVAAPSVSFHNAVRAQQSATFTNPIVTSRNAADPWIVYRNGFYYFTATTGSSIYVWKSRTITGIDSGTKVTVWTPPPTGPQSKNIWAPELHFIRGHWYIYYAADDGRNENHRMYVLESVTDDPQGQYIDRGKIYDRENDRWAIDGTILERDDGSLYFIWSGWEETTDHVAQNLYIAPMSNPWTISGRRVLISRPDQGWEWWINEAPQILKRDGRIFIVYSANGSWTPNYCLGVLTNTNGNVLDPASWTKSNSRVFWQTPNVFGPGHNSFTRSPDGTEDWIVYHATDRPTDGWNNRRPRAQRITWNADNTPNFGYPIAPSTPLVVPSGEVPNATPPPNRGTGSGLTAEYFDNQDFTDLKLRRTDPIVNYTWGLIGGSQAAPVATMGADTFSVRWSGQIQAQFSETYTFHTFADDGVKLWINNQVVIDNLSSPEATVRSGAVTMVAGRRYDIRMEYYDITGAAIARLEWSSPSQPLEVIPQRQLYPAMPSTPALLTEPNTQRAIALDSVTFMRDPLPLITTRNFSSDNRTRATLVAANVDLPNGEDVSHVTAQLEDAGRRIYPMRVEHVGRVPDFDWLTQVTVRLPDELAGINGDVWVSINVRGMQSNKAMITIRPSETAHKFEWQNLAFYAAA
jgi:GH43 family beta-xylosidase